MTLLYLWQVLVEKMGLPGGYTPSMDSSDLLSMLITLCLFFKKKSGCFFEEQVIITTTTTTTTTV